MDTKPCLTLELDSHTADAGINTRLEAFFDIVKNSLEVQQNISVEKTNYYKPATIVTRKGKRYYQDSEGRICNLPDSTVTMLLPNMGDLSTNALAIAFRRSGLKTRVLPVPDYTTLQFGRSVATGKECLPFLICVGLTLQYLESHQNPGERLMVFLPDAAGYCRLGQYQSLTRIILQEKQIENVGVFTLFLNNGFTGLGVPFLWTAWQAVVVSDLLTDIRHAIWALAVDPEDGERRFNTECEHIFASLAGTSAVPFYEQLRISALTLREIPLRHSYTEAPKIMVTGEIFVRREAFSNMYIAKRLAEKGFVVEISPIAEFLRYTNYLIKNKLKPARMDLKHSLELFIIDHTQQAIEKKIKTLLGLSGLCATDVIDATDIIRHCEHLFPRNLHGEFALTAGITLRDALTHYCGIINVGPFGCMQLSLAEGVLTPQTTVKGIKESYRQTGKPLNLSAFDDKEKFPFLTIEADGNPFPQLLEARFEHFCLQASRVAERMGKRVI
jgi:predicted nucleotide-binding protein (sugar kinase/HSP70/actin superfamily)